MTSVDGEASQIDSRGQALASVIQRNLGFCLQLDGKKKLPDRINCRNIVRGLTLPVLGQNRRAVLLHKHLDAF